MVLVRMHRIPSISSLTKARPNNQFQLDIDEYMEQLNREATREDLELSAHNMQKYIGGHVTVNTMLHMLQNKLDTGSKTIYLDSMEARVCYQKNTIKQFGDVITQYEAWHQYVIEKHQVEFSELIFPQTFESQCLVLLGCLQTILSHMDTCGKCNIICKYVVNEIPIVISGMSNVIM